MTHIKALLTEYEKATLDRIVKEGGSHETNIIHEGLMLAFRLYDIRQKLPEAKLVVQIQTLWPNL